MNITEIRKLVEIIKDNELVEFELDEGDFSIRIRRGGETVREVIQTPAYPPAGVPVASPAASPAPDTAAAEEELGVEFIKSPMVGTFYRAPSPESEAFASKGQKVTEESVVCIVEAMKVMNEIQAEKSGTILEALVEDGDSVEYGQPLFKIKA